MIVTNNTPSEVSDIIITNIITIITITDVLPLYPPTFKMWTVMTEDEIINCTLICYCIAMYKFLGYAYLADVINLAFCDFIFEDQIPIKISTDYLSYLYIW